MTTKPPPYNPTYPTGPPPPYQTYPPRGNETTYIPTDNTGSTTYVQPIGSVPTYGTVPIVIQPVTATDVIMVGGCPACRVGVLNEEFTLPGLCCAFWFFPIGILCCLAMKERRCTNCGAIFS